MSGSAVNWKKGLAYFRELNERTYENSPVTKNLVIGKDSGTSDVTETGYAKIFDPLAVSPHVFIRVDNEFRFCDLAEVKWETVHDTQEYKFHPEFLHPSFCALKKGEFSMHKTLRNDLVIMEGGPGGGVIATKRRGRWKLYDASTLKNSLRSIWGNYRIACNAYEIVFDLSFRRHGALLIYDPNHHVLEQIANPHALIHGVDPNPRTAHGILASAIKKIDVAGWKDEEPRIKRVFLELAGLDGAVIFDHHRILAFGAMIKTHEKARGQHGARSTAALSAHHWGGFPIKISTDGDAKIIFAEDSAGTDGELACLDFA